MTDIEQKALALVNEVQAERNHAGSPWNSPIILNEALYRAIERHEAYKQEVSDAVEVANIRAKELKRNTSYIVNHMQYFIIPKPVDPLVEAVGDAMQAHEVYSKYELTDSLRTALAARGGRIVFDQPEGGAA